MFPMSMVTVSSAKAMDLSTGSISLSLMSSGSSSLITQQHQQRRGNVSSSSVELQPVKQQQQQRRTSKWSAGMYGELLLDTQIRCSWGANRIVNPRNDSGDFTWKKNLGEPSDGVGKRDVLTGGVRGTGSLLQRVTNGRTHYQFEFMEEARNLTRHALGTVAVSRATNILSMTGEDSASKLAKDLQNIEQFMPDFDELDKDELQGFLDLEMESSLDLETYRHYEIMFLIHEKNADEVPAVIERVQDFITESKGLIHRLNDWGMRSLAYKIKKASRANYVLMNIEINSQAINVLNDLFEKDERVIRHMVMSQKAAISEETTPPEEYRPSRVAEEEEEEQETEYSDDEEDEEEGTELLLQRERDQSMHTQEIG